MELLHTSPAEITKITPHGRFGEFLFFSANAYSMSVGNVFTYRIRVSEQEIIEAGSIFYHENAAALADIVERVMQIAECDEDTAESLLAQEQDAFSLDNIEPEDAGELSWEIQALTAQAAKRLGFRGVAMQDEQGTCYMIDMLGMDEELELI